MLAKDLIDNALPFLKSKDTGSYALEMMAECKVYHLPVVCDGKYLGLISEQDILDYNKQDDILENHYLLRKNAYVFEYQHFSDVLKMMDMEGYSVIAVTGSDENYLGCVSTAGLLKCLASGFAVSHPGGIIVLEINDNDYQVSEIAQIVESNDTKILSLYITSHKDSTKLDVTLKLNKMDILPIIRTFNRYNYLIKASFTEDQYLEDIKNRYDSLMKYLNI